MKTISVELPDRAAEEIDQLVRAGWFASEGEAVRAAVLDFVRRNRVELLERFQREDIAWALAQKASDG
jgi:Arc/MetJ-type ribon-helix-helix transcriptional regulator